ncbi:hypothetical protein ASPCAL10325 [Aspergillus calidoustus]|uniref:Myb-like domain-containing protein n=1 Tax=Aspergillus calidoustus TaxID=454130 RepID=A0A0U5CC12_ASPCI|nr:hypothetical protein ASPCAL10325 [Aspergillus calidoustus]
MLGHSRSHSRQSLYSKASAPVASSPSRRRVTRSQSREVEDLRAASSSNAIRSSGRNDGSNRWGQNKTLNPVVEESPVGTPQKSVSHYASSRYSSAVPDYADDVANITGTTLLQSEPESEPEPEMMLEALPDLERTGRNLLDYLAPSTANPVTIVNKAEVLSNPANTQSKHLRYLTSKFAAEFRHFGNQTYLEVDAIGRAFNTALAGRRGSFQDWDPDPVVHLANCVRFAHEILLAGPGLNSRKEVIRHIESSFPLPFMSGLVAEGQEKHPGESSLQNDTFHLALDIRTQSLILHLEEHQDEPEFNAKHAVRRFFFRGSSRKTFRGFNLPGFGSSKGTLPDNYAGTVQDRYNEILLAEIGEGGFEVGNLKGAHPWRSFAMRTAIWVRKRVEEIDGELKKRMSAKAVHDAFFTSKHPSFASTLEGPESEPNGELEEVVQHVPQQEIFEGETTLQVEVEPQQEQRPEPRPERRRSSKGTYLDPISIGRMKERLERLRSVSEASGSVNRRQSDIVPPVSQKEREPDRRKTSTLLPASQSKQPAAAPETRALSFESSLFVAQETGEHEELEEPDISLGEDLTLDGGNEGRDIERSDSPPVARSTPSSRPQPMSNPKTLTERIWDVVKGGTITQPAPGPARSSTARFIDRQETAERVSPISQRDSQNAVRRVEERVSRKRARVPPEAETSTDDDFDADERDVDLERRRAEKPQQGSKRRRVVEEDADEEGDHEVANTNTNASRDEEDEVESPRRPDARVRPAHIRTLPRKSLGSRVFWTEAEDNRLMRLMREYGTSWAVIVRQNEAQPVQEGEVRIEGRDQVKFKDRARNIKVKLYREGLPVPDYFENVTIKESDRKKLRELGITFPR